MIDDNLPVSEWDYSTTGRRIAALEETVRRQGAAIQALIAGGKRTPVPPWASAKAADDARKALEGK